MRETKTPEHATVMHTHTHTHTHAHTHIHTHEHTHTHTHTHTLSLTEDVLEGSNELVTAPTVSPETQLLKSGTTTSD